MPWTKKDIIFCKLVLKYAVPEAYSHADEIIAAYNPNILNVKFGEYNIDTNIFTWLNGTNRFFYDTLKNELNRFYEFKDTVRKLFKTRVKLPQKYALTIPYFIYTLMMTYFLMPTNSGNKIQFSLIKLNIKKKFTAADLYHIIHQIHTRRKHQLARNRRTYRK
jgi:hypothetical protein